MRVESIYASVNVLIAGVPFVTEWVYRSVLEQHNLFVFNIASGLPL
jgi:hypothetical protein